MFDMMIVIKVVGVFIGVLLFLMLMKWVVLGIFYVGVLGYGVEGEGYVQVYMILVLEIVEVGVFVDEGLDFVIVMVLVDVVVGEKVFVKCKVCYKLDGLDGVGLYLNGVVGCLVVSIGGFSYLDGMKVYVVDVFDWMFEVFEYFLLNFKVVVFGIKMIFNGLFKVEECVNLIVYLEMQ